MILTTVPDLQVADQLAVGLVAKHLAACVQKLAPCNSIYRWQGTIETATEQPLLIKTTSACANAVTAAIVEYHPYDVPEILVIPIHDGLPSYLSWIGEQCQPPD